MKKDGNNLKKITDRFSETLEPDLYAVVQRIKTQHGAAFRTRSFSPVPTQASGTRWLEASCNEKTGRWKLTESKIVPNIYPDEDGRVTYSWQEALEETKTIAKDLCFFDALHSCARFEVTAKAAVGMPVGKTREQLGVQHYRAFAVREGQLFDQKTNLPLPVADGERLMDGIFEPGAKEIIKSTKGNVLEDVFTKPVMLGEVLDRADNAAIVPVRLDQASENLIQAAEKEQSLAKIQEGNKSTLVNSQSHLENLSKEITYAQENGFKAGSDRLKLTSIFTGFALGAGCMGQLSTIVTMDLFSSGHWIVGSMMGGFSFAFGAASLLGITGVGLLVHDWDPKGEFKRDLRSFQAHLDKMPQSELIVGLRKLAAEADMTYQALWLRHSFRQATKKSGWRTKRTLGKATQAFTDAAQKYGMEKSETEYFIGHLSANTQSTALDDEMARKLKDTIKEANSFMEELAKKNLKTLEGLPFPVPLKLLPGGGV